MRLELKQCSKGHYYNVMEHDRCPYCYPNGSSVIEDEVLVEETKALDMGVAFVDDYEVTTPADMSDGYQPDGLGHCDPAVGWIVGTKGPNRGRAYRLHSGTNFVGRNANMDICIDNDEQISHEKAAAISYDNKSKTFFIEHGTVRNAIYVNGEIVRDDADIELYDRITIGSSDFIFVPLCGNEFNWDEN